MQHPSQQLHGYLSNSMIVSMHILVNTSELLFIVSILAIYIEILRCKLLQTQYNVSCGGNSYLPLVPAGIALICSEESSSDEEDENGTMDTNTEEVMCPDLTTVDGLSGIAITLSTNERTPGTTVTVTCPNGRTATTTCQEDGQWMDVNLVQIVDECNAPF